MMIFTPEVGFLQKQSLILSFFSLSVPENILKIQTKHPNLEYYAVSKGKDNFKIEERLPGCHKSHSWNAWALGSKPEEGGWRSAPFQVEYSNNRLWLLMWDPEKDARRSHRKVEQWEKPQGGIWSGMAVFLCSR